MRPKELTQCLARAITTPGHPPVFIWGPAGEGKSQVAAQASALVGAKLVDLRGSTLDPTDIRGVLMPARGKAVWFQLGELPPPDSEELWVVLLDELNLAPLSVQYAMYQLILDRRAGTYHLPPRCCVIAAGNRPEDVPGVREIPTPLANRFVHIEYTANLDDWVDWASGVRVTGTPPPPLENIDVIPTEMVAFLRLYPEMLSYRHDNGKQHPRAFYRPRTIAYAAKIWHIHRDTSYLWELMEGTVGREWAAKFGQFIKLMNDIPNVEAILDGKTKAVPTRADLQYAVATLLATKTEIKHLEAVIRYSNLLPPEPSTLLVQLLLRRPGFTTPMVKTPAMREWLGVHRDFTVPK